ncbi:beta-defensin 1 [Suricata suricatta]|uniref:beta-defensin 1 n=1 Tax=Suricata suricatta TaxID=37032 RepID=UPI001155A4DF|nr:beta-defensin 1 [Suricata suricatta]
MRALYFLLLTLCLIFSNLAPGLGQWSDQYICARQGGTCSFSPCPLFTKIYGTCYSGKAKCCMR